MDYYAGIDVSLEVSSVCVVDASGTIVKEAKVSSEPDALTGWFKEFPFALARIGLEAGPLSQWLYAGFKEAGFAVELLETRHVRDAFKTMPVKTDRNDARGIAQLMRLGWFRPVHCKSVSAQETRALLTARKLVQGKLYDVQMSLRGILRGFGLKVGPTTKAGFASRIMELTEHHPALEAIAKALLAVHEVLLRELNGFEKQVRKLARGDNRVRLLMTAPGVGVIVGLTYVAAIDDPERFSSSKKVGAHFGMTPKKYQSGETDVTRADLQDRRQGRARGALRGRPYHPDNAGQRRRLEELGGEARQARGDAEGKSCACQEACGAPAPHAGGWRHLRRRQGCRGMSGPACSTMAPCSQPSTPLRAAYGGGLRPVLTATARGALRNSGRDGETPFSQTEKLSAARCGAKGEALDGFRAG